MVNDDAVSRSDDKRGLAAAGSVIGAILASSCCIVPLVLISLGATGAWIGQLTAMKAFQPLFVALTGVFLAYGFWRVYGNAGRRCEDDSCETPRSSRIVRAALWTATLLVVAALTTDYWAALFY